MFVHAPSKPLKRSTNSLLLFPVTTYLFMYSGFGGADAQHKKNKDDNIKKIIFIDIFIFHPLKKYIYNLCFFRRHCCLSGTILVSYSGGIQVFTSVPMALVVFSQCPGVLITFIFFIFVGAESSLFAT